MKRLKYNYSRQQKSNKVGVTDCATYMTGAVHPERTAVAVERIAVAVERIAVAAAVAGNNLLITNISQ